MQVKSENAKTLGCCECTSKKFKNIEENFESEPYDFMIPIMNGQQFVADADRRKCTPPVAHQFKLEKAMHYRPFDIKGSINMAITGVHVSLMTLFVMWTISEWLPPLWTESASSADEM